MSNHSRRIGLFARSLSRPSDGDIIVFTWPQDPSQTYAMRLVGLPGEEIVIRDGAVWADGAKLTPPEYLQGTGLSSGHSARTSVWVGDRRGSGLACGRRVLRAG